MRLAMEGASACLQLNPSSEGSTPSSSALLPPSAPSAPSAPSSSSSSRFLRNLQLKRPWSDCLISRVEAEVCFTVSSWISFSLASRECVSTAEDARVASEVRGEKCCEEEETAWRRHIVAGKKYRWILPPAWLLALLNRAVFADQRTKPSDSRRILSPSSSPSSSSSKQQWLLKLCDWNEAAFYFWASAQTADRRVDSGGSPVSASFGRVDAQLTRVLNLLQTRRASPIRKELVRRNCVEEEGKETSREETTGNERDGDEMPTAPSATPFPAVLLDEGDSLFENWKKKRVSEVEAIALELTSFMPRCACVFWKHGWRPAFPVATSEFGTGTKSVFKEGGKAVLASGSSSSPQEVQRRGGPLALTAGAAGGSFCCAVLLEDVCSRLGGACVMDLKMGRQMHSEACLDSEKIRRMKQKAASRSFHSHGFALCGVAAPSHSRPRGSSSSPLSSSSLSSSSCCCCCSSSSCSSSPSLGGGMEGDSSSASENTPPFSAPPVQVEKYKTGEGLFPPPFEFQLSPSACYSLRSDAAFLEAFRKFFSVNGSARLAARLVFRCLEKLERVEKFFKRQTCLAFHGASLLFVFDSDPEPPQSANFDGGAGNSSWDVEEAAVDSLQIVLVDFAHVSLVRSAALDEGFLFGLANIQRLLKTLHEELVDSRKKLTR